MYEPTRLSCFLLPVSLDFDDLAGSDDAIIIYFSQKVTKRERKTAAVRRKNRISYQLATPVWADAVETYLNRLTGRHIAPD